MVPPLLSKLIKRTTGAFSDGFFELLKRLIKENLPEQWRRWLLALMFMTIAAAATALWVWLQKDLVNSIFFQKKMDLLIPMAAAALVLPLIRGFATFGQEVVLGRIGNRIVADVQRRIYKHILSFGLDFFGNFPSSQLILYVNTGAESARGVLNTLVLSVGRDALTLAGLIVVMAIQSPILLLIAAIVTPLIMVTLTKVVMRVRHFINTEYALQVRLIQLLQETVQGARLIKAYNLKDHMNEEVNRAASSIERFANKVTRLKAVTSPVLEVIGGLAIGLITLYCGYRTANGTATAGEFVSFSAALLFAYEPAKRLARLRVDLESSVVGLRLLYSLLDQLPSDTELEAGKPFEFKRGQVEFKQVTFGYRPGQPVITDLSFKVANKKKIALVGPSGAGKTTILSLISRFYDIQAGSIVIDGQDVRSVTPSSLRHYFAVVTQDAYMLSGTVRDNLRIGRKDATDAELEQAAKDAYAHDFIVELRNGYDTDVGENGVQLSGGQRQRIAIARAILKAAPVLLLDEATSSLDTQSERIVQLALDRLMQDRTTFVIAHRLSTILNADLVLVIDRGELVEQGTHRELLAKGGLYRDLYAHQFAEVPRDARREENESNVEVA